MRHRTTEGLTIGTLLLNYYLLLALTNEDLQHNSRCHKYLECESARRLAYYRTSIQGLHRLATNARVMHDRLSTKAEVLKFDRDSVALHEVIFLAESTDIEEQLAAHSESPTLLASRWTASCLIAFAHCTGLSLVDFDADFHTLPGLGFLHLQPV